MRTSSFGNSLLSYFISRNIIRVTVIAVTIVIMSFLIMLPLPPVLLAPLSGQLSPRVKWSSLLLHYSDWLLLY